MKFLTLIILFSGLSFECLSQDLNTVGSINYGFSRLPGSFKPIGNPAKTKWSYSTYSGISTGFIGWKGGNATLFSVPVGVQLNRQLNNNLFAFTGLNVAPTFVYSRGNFIQQDFQKNSFSPMKNNSSFNMQSRAELGLMYVNDNRTFSISGSIGIEQRSYPFPVISSNNSRFNNFNRNTW